jgi:hypothetical protein
VTDIGLEKPAHEKKLAHHVPKTTPTLFMIYDIRFTRCPQFLEGLVNRKFAQLPVYRGNSTFTGQAGKVVAHCDGHGFDESKIPVGVVHLGRHCQRVSDLRLAATGGDTLRRRRGNDGSVVFRSRPADVAYLHRNDGGGLLAVETRVLKIGGTSGPPWRTWTLQGSAELRFGKLSQEIVRSRRFGDRRSVFRAA